MSLEYSLGLEFIKDFPGDSKMQTSLGTNAPPGTKLLLFQLGRMKKDLEVMSPPPCTSVDRAERIQRCYPRFQVGLQGPTGKTGIATQGKVIDQQREKVHW